MKVYGVIPGRLQSTRLPRKLLLAETGKPLIQYVWESARKAHLLADVLIATDNTEIADAVRGFGGRAEMTGDHPSGTDRIAEVARRSLTDADIIVNIQGDEPELNPAQIDRVVRLLIDDPSAPMATLATPLHHAEQVLATSCVKVVCGANGQALYFSRSPIPHLRDRDVAEVLATGERPWLLHLGIYAYRRDFLLNITRQPPSRLENQEKLEQLRALEAGARIAVGVVDQPSVGIDTPEDYARFVSRQLSVASCSRRAA
jgi:3-deoxy-manno-octulosonate cytidylyltransferase (CMP-KDO synthetase)